MINTPKRTVLYPHFFRYVKIRNNYLSIAAELMVTVNKELGTNYNLIQYYYDMMELLRKAKDKDQFIDRCADYLADNSPDIKYCNAVMIAAEFIQAFDNKYINKELWR